MVAIVQLTKAIYPELKSHSNYVNWGIQKKISWNFFPTGTVSFFMCFENSEICDQVGDDGREYLAKNVTNPAQYWTKIIVIGLLMVSLAPISVPKPYTTLMAIEYRITISKCREVTIPIKSNTFSL